jgi:hypothetical protein
MDVPDQRRNKIAIGDGVDQRPFAVALAHRRKHSGRRRRAAVHLAPAHHQRQRVPNGAAR